MIDSILISPSGEEIICKYYEINEISKKIIKDLCDKDRTMKEKFDEFSKNYGYFEPFFDFLLCELGYVIKNPFNFENAVFYAKNKKIFLKHLSEDFEIFGLSSDDEIGLEKVNEHNMGISMVDGNLMAIKPKGIKRHEIMSRFILNNYFIKNKQMYEEYIEDSKESIFYYYRYVDFLCSHLPFIRLEKDTKNEKNENLAMFKDCDVSYLVTGFNSTMTEQHKTFLEEMILKNIIPAENIFIHESDKEKNI